MAAASESVTVAAVAIGLTAATVGQNTNGLLYVETAAIRYQVDGTSPVAGGAGIPVSAGSTIELHNADELSKFKAIRETGVSATLRCQYGFAMFMGGR